MRFIFAITAMLFVISAHAENVRGYTRSDGTYTQGYQRSTADQYRYNNYGSETNGGSQRDEYSTPPQYNKSYPYAPR